MTDTQENTGDKPAVRIAAICGSLIRESRTKAAVSLALQGASEFEVETQLMELRDYALPFFGQIDEKDYPPDVFQLREQISDLHGIIVGTPEYYGSLTGALKNALDVIGSEVMRGKIVGLVGIAGGDTGAVNSLNTMRIIGRNLHCWVLPQEVSIANSAKSINEDGTVVDLAIKERLLEIGRQVAKFATLQRRVRQEDFMQLWEGLPRW